jgi:transcriptional regulator with XRE-family HTH domain
MPLEVGVDLKQTFGVQVRHHRKAQRLTQDELAERVDVARETIGNIERGVAAPSFETAERIAAALDLPASVLFGVAEKSAPRGKRGRQLARINRTLSNLNDEQLLRVAKMLEAFAGT